MSLKELPVLSLNFSSRITGDLNAPLLIMVHGRSGDEKVMWGFKSIIPDEFNVIAPRAFVDDPQGGYSWWRIDQDNYGAREYALERLKYFIDECIQTFALTPQKIILIGFSQGAALLSLFIQRDPYSVDGVGILAGFIVRGQVTMVPGELPRTRIFVAHGSEDKVIPVSKAKEGYEHLRDSGFEIEFCEDPVAHKIGTNGMRGLKNFLRSFLLQH